MIVLLLLVCSYFSVGVSNAQEYGSTYRFRLFRRTETIEFTPVYNSDVTVLWRRDDPPDRKRSRGIVMGSYYVINNVTQKDSGHYIMKDRDDNVFSTKTMEVVERHQHYSMSAGETFRFTFDLPQISCNIGFISDTANDPEETVIVRQGWQREYPDINGCLGFYMLKPCGIIIEDVQTACSGLFVVRDADGNKALAVSLKIQSPDSGIDSSSVGIGFGIVFIVLSCCTCLKHLCCSNSSSKKDASETADAEPAVHYHEHDHEPVGQRPEHLSPPSQTSYPAQPSPTPTDPLEIHNPPAMNEPPPYSECSTPAEQADAPLVPADSDPEPTFELKGLTFPSAPPLSSDSPYCDVYTSDKLNFL